MVAITIQSAPVAQKRIPMAIAWMIQWINAWAYETQQIPAVFLMIVSVMNTAAGRTISWLKNVALDVSYRSMMIVDQGCI